MKYSFKTLAALFLAGFLAFFALRLGYGYVMFPNGEKLSTGLHIYEQSQFASFKGRNIAGQKQKVVVGGAQPALADQRYEKVADIGLKSDEFESESAKLREIIKRYNALVQYEQSNGLSGSRIIQLALGVNPENFDRIIEELKGLGELQSLQINKTDKTNEYRSLKATQKSLTKSRDALLALKDRDAKVEEMIGLEQRILEIEQQIQDLGVNLGDFDSENEFVTVKLTLYEVAKSGLRNISLLARSFTALVWALKYYGLFVFSFMGFLIAALAGMKVLEIGIRMTENRKPNQSN